MKTTVTKEIKWKDSSIPVVPVGTQIDLTWPNQEKPGHLSFNWNGQARTVGGRILTKTKVKIPGMKSLERWSFDGVAKSVGGKRVEPDGWDDDNTPSWLLLLGVI